MTTGQITTVTILIIIWLFCYYKVFIRILDHIGLEKTSSYLLGLFIMTGFLIMLLATVTSRLNQANLELKNKCPELEKIDNVYKIKT